MGKHDALLESIVEEWYTLLVIYGSQSLMSKLDMAQACLDSTTATFIILKTYDKSSDIWRKALMLNETLIDMIVKWNLGKLMFASMKKDNHYTGYNK